MSSINTVPCCCTYSTILSAKSGSVSTLFSHHSKANNNCMNTSTWPSSGHNSTCSGVSSWIVQHGHLLLRPSQCLWRRFLFMAAMFITCFYAHTWNSLGTSLVNVRCTCGLSTSSNASVNILDVLWKNKRATCLPATYLMCAPMSEVIFVSSTNMHIGSSGNTSCCGRAVMSCELSIAFVPALHASLSCAALDKSSHSMSSSWCASTWIYSQWKERPPQLTSIVFSISECLHRVGMQYGGSSATRPKAPKQPEYIFT